VAFQKLLEIVLNGIPNVAYYIDDMLVTGKDDAEHLKTLRAVFDLLQEYKFYVNRTKCKFIAINIR